MNTRFRIRPIDIMVIAAIVAYGGWKSLHRPPKVEPSEFAKSVNLEPLFKTAVQADGRLRSFESHAAVYVKMISGGHDISGQSAGFTYLDLIFRPHDYLDKDAIHIKNKPIRMEIVSKLREAGAVDDDRAKEIEKSGLISPQLLARPEVGAVLQKYGSDLRGPAKAVDAIQNARLVAQPNFLLGLLRTAPPADNDPATPWVSAADLMAYARGVQVDELLGSTPELAGLAAGVRDQLASTWNELRSAWVAADAARVNAAIAKLADLFPQTNPDRYPDSGKLGLESWYFRYKSMTWVWLIYLAAVIPLLMSVIYRWDGARKIGMGIFVVAFLGHTASLLIRWYVSGRWPNANMFEAVHTSAWFGGLVAIFLEYFVRNTPFRSLFALGSGAVSMASLMAGFYMPADLDPTISNKMAALHDIWLYIHTNVIIAAYALIGLAAVTALLQLRHRWCVAWDEGTIPTPRLLMLPIAAAVLNLAVYKVLMHYVDHVGHSLSEPLFSVGGLQFPKLAGWIVVLGASGLVLLLELVAAHDRVSAGGKMERSAVGGASQLILGARRSSASFFTAAGPTMSQIYDGATMVLMELSFVMLWAGIVMGAVWADHSWGRPWGWDPKEVFALNTFIIFAILIHVRLKVRDKSLWTAVLGMLGFEVMMFNWIVINFIISGLHSYA